MRRAGSITVVALVVFAGCTLDFRVESLDPDLDGFAPTDIVERAGDAPGAIDGGCAAGLTWCETSCVNLTFDPSHCGSCPAACPGVSNASPACAASRCTFLCTLGFADCDRAATTGCEVDTSSDDLNCGTCGTRCRGSSHCLAGVCN